MEADQIFKEGGAKPDEESGAKARRREHVGQDQPQRDPPELLTVTGVVAATTTRTIRTNCTPNVRLHLPTEVE
jgi:hypothetical protein